MLKNLTNMSSIRPVVGTEFLLPRTTEPIGTICNIIEGFNSYRHCYKCCFFDAFGSFVRRNFSGVDTITKQSQYRYSELTYFLPLLMTDWKNILKYQNITSYDTSRFNF